MPLQNQVQEAHAIAGPRIQLQPSAADTAGLLLMQAPCLGPGTSMEAVNDFFGRPEGRKLAAVPIVQGGKPVGLISRPLVIEKFSQRYFRELHGKKAVSEFMNPAPIVVEHTVSLDDLSRIITGGEQQALADGFIITENGRYLGMGTGHALVRELAERKEAHLYHMAYHDVLTGLPNRQLFYDRLHQALALAQRYRHELAVFFIDLDHFKSVNDTLGHQAGDQLLVAVCQRLRDCLRESDTLARLGGDEFTAILNELKSSHDALAVAQNILQALAQPFEILGQAVHITTSIGISLYPADGESMETLVKNADNALYQAKETRNDYRFYKASMNELVSQRQKLEGELREALSQGQLLLQYQPQRDMQQRRVKAAEVFVHWSHPQRGWIEPQEFSRMLAQTSLGLQVERWVLRTACARAATWQAKGLKPVRMALKLSSLHFKRTDFLNFVSQCLQESGLHGRWLVLEIPEQLFHKKNPEIIKNLEGLRALGVGLSLGDFGSEASGLAFLRQGLLDEFKISKSIVAKLGTQALDSALAASLVQVANALDARVVAEGVDKQPQYDFLFGRGCHEVKGPLLGGDMPASWFEEMLEKESAEP